MERKRIDYHVVVDPVLHMATVVSEISLSDLTEAEGRIKVGFEEVVDDGRSAMVSILQQALKEVASLRAKDKINGWGKILYSRMHGKLPR